MREYIPAIHQLAQVLILSLSSKCDALESKLAELRASVQAKSSGPGGIIPNQSTVMQDVRMLPTNTFICLPISDRSRLDGD